MDPSIEEILLFPNLSFRHMILLLHLQLILRGHTTTYEYNDDWSLSKVTDYLGRENNYYYDSFGRNESFSGLGFSRYKYYI